MKFKKKKEAANKKIVVDYGYGLAGDHLNIIIHNEWEVVAMQIRIYMHIPQFEFIHFQSEIFHMAIFSVVAFFSSTMLIT